MGVKSYFRGKLTYGLLLHVNSILIVLLPGVDLGGLDQDQGALFSVVPNMDCRQFENL